MKESLNTAYIVTIVVSILILIELILFASFSYSKAYKIKNRVLEMISDNEGFDDGLALKIEAELSRVGYRIAGNAINSRCPSVESIMPSSNGKVTTTFLNPNSNYEYCVYKSVETNEGRGTSTYYSVVSFMYFDTPIINFSFPVKGQTKAFFEYEV